MDRNVRRFETDLTTQGQIQDFCHPTNKGDVGPPKNHQEELGCPAGT